MATLHCTCGHRTHLSGHTDNEMFLLTNDQIEDLAERLDKEELTGDGLNTSVVDEGQLTYRCEKCLRLYVHGTENGKLAIKVYNLENTLRDEEGANGAL